MYKYTRLCLDQRVPRDRLIGLSSIAHEHIHNLQGQLGCLPGPDDHEYAWWVEGSATYVGWHTLVEAGMTSGVFRAIPSMRWRIARSLIWWSAPAPSNRWSPFVNR